MIYQPIENTGEYTTGTVYSEEYVKRLEQEIERLNNRIHALEKHNKKLQLEAQKYFDLLMECEYEDKGEDKE